MEIFKYNNIYILHTIEINTTIRYDVPLLDAIAYGWITQIEADLLISNYVVNKEIDRLNRERAEAVANIIITLSDGVTILNGDETAQNRMNRAVTGLPDDVATNMWIGANGDVYMLNKLQFQEAIRLAGEAQTVIWIEYTIIKSQLVV